MHQAGNIRVVLLLLVFLLFSTVVSFGGVWIMFFGFKKPFHDEGARKTAEDLSGADSLRAVELVLRQDLGNLENHITQLSTRYDSLTQAIEARRRTIAQMEAEIRDLNGQLEKASKQRLQKLAGIVAGLSKETLRSMSEILDDSTLALLVNLATPRKAQAILDAMHPEKAARVAAALARLKIASN